MNLEIRRQIENLFNYFKSNKMTVPSTDNTTWEFELNINKKSVYINTILSSYVDGYIYNTCTTWDDKLYFHFDGTIWWEGNETEYYSKYFQ